MSAGRDRKEREPRKVLQRGEARLRIHNNMGKEAVSTC